VPRGPPRRASGIAAGRTGEHGTNATNDRPIGRGDGENYQIGFITITDTPYPETIQASRDAGYDMYEYRMKAK
jgi:hypothetical protein